MRPADPGTVQTDSTPIRVLHVFGRVGRGGAESRTMELYRLMDKSLVQFDFLVHVDAGSALDSDALMAARERDDFDEEILALGGHIYALPRPSFSRPGTGLMAYRTACGRFFDGHRGIWRVVQGHMTSTAAVTLAAAKRAGAEVTIAHARSAGTDPGLKGMLTKVLRAPLARESFGVRLADGRRVSAVDQRFACSHEAARAVFGGAETVFLPNAVCLDRFRYRPEVRGELREALGLSDSLVIGHVGSFRYAKNHELLLRAFARLTTLSEEKVRLLLIGDGTLFEEMRALARSLGIDGRVVFTGSRDDVWRCYQAMDLLAFPSRYEGLPGTVVEAQASGLPCLISDRITGDVDVTALVQRASIGKGKSKAEIARAEEDWAERMMAMLKAPAFANRAQASAGACAALKAAGFDAESQAKQLEAFYCTGVWM